MKQLLIDTLTQLGFGEPSSQGSYQEGEPLPNSFFTFWNFETNPQYLSNKIIGKEYVYRVFFYSIDPSLTNSVLDKARTLLEQNNFHCGGDFDIDTDVEYYTGREMEVRYLQIYKEEQ